jgi:hypothetical protein
VSKEAALATDKLVCAVPGESPPVDDDGLAEAYLIDTAYVLGKLLFVPVSPIRKVDRKAPFRQ